MIDQDEAARSAGEGGQTKHTESEIRRVRVRVRVLVEERGRVRKETPAMVRGGAVRVGYRVQSG